MNRIGREDRLLSIPRFLLLLAAGLILSGFDLSPETWVRDIANLWKRDAPSVQNITFWDFKLNASRGIRALLYTVPKERENRMVDLRLYQKMAHFLAYMCQEVITLDAFEEPNQKRLIEQALVQLVDQWKVKGEIDPSSLFQMFPSLHIDILVLMERTYYDQIWKGDEKRLAIGVNAAAFEMDFGKSVYQDRVIVEAPWTGESISYVKAEHAALLKVADAMGEKIQNLADNINRAHEKLEQQKLEEQKKQEIARIAQLDQETENFAQLINQAQEIINSKNGPQDLLGSMQKDMDELKPLLVTSSGKSSLRDKFRSPYFKPETKTISASPEEELTRRRTLADSLRSQLESWQDWKKQQEEKQKQEAVANQPSLKQAGVNLPGSSSAGRQSGVPTNAPAAENWVGLPSINYPQGQLFDRRWLLPSNRAVQTGPVPILSATGSLPRMEIQSAPIPQNLPASFRKLLPENLPPPPLFPASGAQIIPASQTAGMTSSATP